MLYAKITVPEIKVVANLKGKAIVPVFGHIEPEGVLTMQLST